jgi:hypothetical protein
MFARHKPMTMEIIYWKCQDQHNQESLTLQEVAAIALVMDYIYVRVEIVQHILKCACVILSGPGERISEDRITEAPR